MPARRRQHQIDTITLYETNTGRKTDLTRRVYNMYDKLQKTPFIRRKLRRLLAKEDKTTEDVNLIAELQSDIHDAERFATRVFQDALKFDCNEILGYSFCNCKDHPFLPNKSINLVRTELNEKQALTYLDFVENNIPTPVPPAPKQDSAAYLAQKATCKNLIRGALDDKLEHLTGGYTDNRGLYVEYDFITDDLKDVVPQEEAKE